MIQHKGFIYEPFEDREEDNIKIFHDVMTPSGQKISMPLSPYVSPTQLHFEKWVEIGCPTERKIIITPCGHTLSSTWDLKDIEEAFSKKF
jgi:hypothetical protein